MRFLWGEAEAALRLEGARGDAALTDGDKVFLYLDGEQDGSCNAGNGPVVANPQVYVGGDPVDHRYFTGLLDDLRLYDRALGPAEVQALRAATSLP